MKNRNQLIAIPFGMAILSLGACANTGAAYMPIVDGPRDARFTQDVAECRALAEERKLLNGNTKQTALIAAGLTGLAVLADDKKSGLGDALFGGIVGGAFGAGAGAFEVREERQQIMKNCMSGRGHNVVG